MKLSNCIHELLLENEIVIIPGFGAFVSHYKPAEIHPETDEIKPPSKGLSFNQKIRNNDGLLVGYIAEKEGISHFDALKRIEKDRENIIYQLDKGEKITFDNIGVLFRNKNNEIEFESFQQKNLLLDSFGLEETSLIQPEPTTEEEYSEKEEVAAGDNIATSAETEQISHSEPEIQSETPEETSFSEDEQFWETLKKNAPLLLEKKEKKRRVWLWFLLIFIPILIAGYFLYNKQNQNVPQQITEEIPAQDNDMTKSPQILPTDSTKTDSTQKGITENPQTETSQANVTSGTKVINQGNYYLVGGSFKEEKNAEKFIHEFNAEGYTPFHLGKRGNFYIVAIGRYKSEKEAVEAQNKFTEKNPDSGTWVFKDETK